MIKVITILGTRPEIIRLSQTILQLDKYVDHILVHTGQNYDYELNEVFFQDLNLRKPDYFLNVDTNSLASVYAGVLMGVEKVFLAEKPDAVLILGDTNSAISAIVARRMKIPVYHMEAGNRCFDLNVPEETNRRIVDHVSDFNLVYTEHARRNLLSEGIASRRIYLIGSPMQEVLNAHIKNIECSTVLPKLGLSPDKYFLASIHREENVDREDRLSTIINALVRVSEEFSLPVIVSTHPRTRKRIEALGIKDKNKNIRFMKPFGFHDYIKLQRCARCVISDSGTICEESAILNFPAVTVRDAIEHPEALDTGSIIMTGLDVDTIVSAIKAQTDSTIRFAFKHIPEEYKVTDTSLRVFKLILGTVKVSNCWDGIRDFL